MRRPMRQYCIGAMLLDLENPAKIIARWMSLACPHENEREDMFQCCLFCGALIHNNELVIPYPCPISIPASQR